MRDGDIVVGEFLGDQDLLVRTAATDESGVCVALPLDARGDWYPVGRDLTVFLERYLAAGGDKFWETPSA